MSNFNQLIFEFASCDVALQQSYFKCAYECFDRRMKQEEISNCVEHCSVPVLKAQNLVETEMAKFQVPAPPPSFSSIWFSYFLSMIKYIRVVEL